MDKRKIQDLNFTKDRVGGQMVKTRRLKRIGVNSVRNLKKIKNGGNNMKKNSGKIMTQLYIKKHKEKSHNNSKQKQNRLILEYKWIRAYV